MKTAIKTTGIDFENFLSIFYTVYDGSDKTLEKRFISVISSLERNLQDLDTQNKDQIWLREIVILKLRYWEKLLKETIYLFKNDDEFGTQLLINSLIYCLKFLYNKTLPALSVADVAHTTQQVIDVLPHPDNYFIKHFHESAKISLSYPVVLLVQFIENYANDKLNVYKDNRITFDEIDFLEIIKESIEKGGLYNKVLDSYIQSEMNESVVSEIPIFIYLDTDNYLDSENYCEKIKNILATIDSDIFFKYKPVEGSWLLRLIARTRRVATSENVTNGLKIIGHGLETYAINKTQSEIDKNQAEAVKAILDGCANIPRLVTLIGSLLIVKTTNEQNESVVIARTLTLNEQIYLKANPIVMQNPSTIMMELEKNSLDLKRRSAEPEKNSSDIKLPRIDFESQRVDVTRRELED